jgi:hypothetical protein
MPESVHLAAALSPGHQGRLKWALQGMSQALMTALQRDRSPEAAHLRKLDPHDPADLIGRLIMERADPAANKRFTPWLVREYAAGRLILEDLGTANETLTLFQRYARRLAPEARDIQRYGSLADAWEAVREFADREEAHSNKAQKVLDRAKAYAESRILRQDEDGFTIAVPLTEFAAKWWGKGTRWCTAAEKDNQFWHYHLQAPLIVTVLPKLGRKGKFQLWFAYGLGSEYAGETQFRDAADEWISESDLTLHWPRFEPLIKRVLAQIGDFLENVPEDLRTEELCKIAVRQNGEALIFVPEELRTEEICKIAIGQEGRALDCVPEHLRSEEICKIAVRQNGLALEFVPPWLLSEEMREIALSQNGRALRFVRRSLRTPELCEIAVRQTGTALSDTPLPLRTKALCDIAVKHHGEALEQVPWALRSEKIVEIAIRNHGEALKHVPGELRTEGLCLVAVEQSGSALEHVPEALRTDELCRLAVARDGYALAHVPTALQTEEMCKIAVAQNGQALEHVPIHRRTEDVSKISVRQDPWALLKVPEKDVCFLELAKMAVLGNWCVLSCVSRSLRPLIEQQVPPPATALRWPLHLLDELEENLHARPAVPSLGPEASSLPLASCEPADFAVHGPACA